MNTEDKIIKRKQIIISSLFLIFFIVTVLVFALFTYGRKFESNYEVGTIYSSDSKNKSKIYCYSNDHKEINQISLPYGGMGHDGIINAQIKSNVLYECPVGIATKKDLGIVTGFDIKSGHTEVYHFNRTNITGCCVSDDYIYASSNLNGVNYIDRMNKKTTKIDTIQLKDSTVFNMVVVGDVLYGFRTDMNTEKWYIEAYDFDKRETTGTKQLDSIDSIAPSFSISHEDNVFFVVNSYLCRYNVNDGELQKTALQHSNGHNILKDGEVLYIGCTDIHNGGESYIETYNINDMKPINTCKVDLTIMQMEVVKNNLYISDFEKINKYKISSQMTLEKENTFVCASKSNYNCRGFFAKGAK